jgi:hypothetical protein
MDDGFPVLCCGETLCRVSESGQCKKASLNQDKQVYRLEIAGLARAEVSVLFCLLFLFFYYF